MSPYIKSIRDRIGHDLLLLPAVSAVIRDEHDRVLLAQVLNDEQWALIGGGVEPGEDPADAIAREIREEIGVQASVGSIIGAYGGEGMFITYPNGDRCAYVSVAYACRLSDDTLVLEPAEVAKVGWFTAAEIPVLRTQPYVMRILADAGLSM